MKPALITLLLLAVACMALAVSTVDCVDAETACDASCCGNLGGSYSHSDNTCTAPSSSVGEQYLACRSTCTTTKLECIAPGSACTQQYITCAQQCSGTQDQREECLRMHCNLAASLCAVNAKNNAGASGGNGGTSGGGCCGGFIILLAAGSGILLARRF